VRQRREGDRASSRLRNSGVNMRLMSAISSPACLPRVKPIEVFDRIRRLRVVMMITTLRKSALRRCCR